MLLLNEKQKQQIGSLLLIFGSAFMIIPLLWFNLIGLLIVVYGMFRLKGHNKFCRIVASVILGFSLVVGLLYIPGSLKDDTIKALAGIPPLVAGIIQASLSFILILFILIVPRILFKKEYEELKMKKQKEKEEKMETVEEETTENVETNDVISENDKIEENIEENSAEE